MYLEHFGLSEPPFRITPHTDFFFSGANRGATLEALVYAILNEEGIVKVSGEVGCGKTMLCRVLMERLPRNVETIFLANPSLSRDEILYAIADELQLDYSNMRPARLLRVLQDRLIELFSEGRRVVLLIDEAHAMPGETLEEIRLLSNLETNRHKLLQIVLFGQPELDEHLDKSELRQLKERITQMFRLEPMVRGDIESYIDFRMRKAGYRGPNVFSPGAIRLIAGASKGLTRRINILADKSLLAAFAFNAHAVTEKEARRAIRDASFHRNMGSHRQVWVAAATLLVGLSLGLGLRSLLSGPDPLAAGEMQPAHRTSAAAIPDRVSPRDPAGASDAGPAPQPPERMPPLQSATAPPAQAPIAQVPPAPAPEATRTDQTPDVAKAARGPPAGLERPFPSQTDVSENVPAPPSRGRLAKQRFAAAQEWLKHAPGNQYAIQFLAVKASELARLEEFLVRASKAVPLEQLYVYSVKIDGVQHYRATYGLFPSAAEAMTAMRSLPMPLKDQFPFLRSVERIRSMNRQ